ncbi:monoacylglycerol lipase ABHD2-like [Sycon ciliatum]|uniref:monoacylglycerol lipase ABHD2-like n=1 Tax=Sycon ciliatum TaxID=27933 RepID=UPI0031F65E86
MVFAMTPDSSLTSMFSDLSSSSASSVYSLGSSLNGFLSPYLVLLAFLALVLVRLFRLLEPAEVPEVFHSSSGFAQEIVSKCPILAERYRPTSLWGKNRHIQIWSFGVLGRPSTPRPAHSLHAGVTDDGTRFTFGLFESKARGAYVGVPVAKQPVTVLCPGIAGNSYSSYIQTYIDEMLKQLPHSRVVSLNHVGTIKDEELSSARIFSYGCTSEYSAVVDWTRERFPGHPLVAIGFSMGANILVKYLAERPERQTWFKGAMSCCQSYSAKTLSCYLDSGVVPRLYSSVLVMFMRTVVSQHRGKLFGERARISGAKNTLVRTTAATTPAVGGRVCSKNAVSCAGGSSCPVPPPDETRALSAHGMVTFDEYFSRRMWHFDSIDEYYSSESCGTIMHKVTNVPILFVNAADDPLVPAEALEFPLQHSRKNENSVFVKTRHGSHLAFYEGGVVIPNTVSWLDRLSIQYFRAILDMPADSQGDH